MDIAMEVDIGSEDKADVSRILAADCEWLASNNLLDYSLLLGINRTSVPRAVPRLRRNSTVQAPNRRATAASVGAGSDDLDAAGSEGGADGTEGVVLEEGEEEEEEEDVEAGDAFLSDPCSFVSVDGRKVFHMGMVDVLEENTCAWTVQHYSLRSALCLICQWSYMDGITAMSPDEYAGRFRHFIESEVLHLQVQPEEESLGDVLARHRWGKLYTNQRNGLLARRMNDEITDRQAAMDSLEAAVGERDSLLMELTAYKERYGEIEPRREPRKSQSQ